MLTIAAMFTNAFVIKYIREPLHRAELYNDSG